MIDQLVDSILATDSIWSRSYLLHLQILMSSLKLTRVDSSCKMANYTRKRMSLRQWSQPLSPCTELTSHHAPPLTLQDSLVLPTVLPR